MALEYVHPLAPPLTNHYASNLGFADGNPPQRPRPEVQMANRDEREGTIQLRASFQMQKTLFGCLPPSSLSRSHGVFFPSLFDSGNLPPSTKHYSNSPLSTSKSLGSLVKASTAPARQDKASHRSSFASSARSLAHGRCLSPRPMATAVARLLSMHRHGTEPIPMVHPPPLPSHVPRALHRADDKSPSHDGRSFPIPLSM
ncbi:hypothetical protein FSOLCH5_007163 [Fusarium solani]|uniref:Uncharacterized protein n=2 Tax=Fusarium solani TaxID=169388 RepID=A0A9P9L1H0_FUSSL|nr:uncharacterized protein B0J15DRAFT_171712 [Fusarium solani]KAH7272253.1 hypothetical protein B0J15DRAFT_171712 [Fusarium solani]